MIFRSTGRCAGRTHGRTCSLVLVVNLTVIALFGWIKSSVEDAEPRLNPSTEPGSALRRQDTWSDLQLVLVVNLTVITLFGWIKSSVVDALDTTLSHAGPKPFWLSIYEVRWHSHRRLLSQ